MLLSFLLLSLKADFLYFVNPNQSLFQPDSFAVGGQIMTMTTLAVTETGMFGLRLSLCICVLNVCWLNQYGVSSS